MPGRPPLLTQSRYVDGLSLSLSGHSVVVVLEKEEIDLK
jgi:hypothetical protein